MAMFDGSRWDRIRRTAYGGAVQLGRLRLFADFHAWSMPLPWISVFFELQHFELSLRFGTRGLTDDVFAVGFGVDLPGDVADVLVAVWPGRMSRGERRAALRRLARLDIAPEGGTMRGDDDPKREEGEMADQGGLQHAGSAAGMSEGEDVGTHGAPGEDEPLREEEVREGDALDDRVEEESLPGDE